MSERTKVSVGTRVVSAQILSDEEIASVEQLHSEGLTAKEVVQMFTARGAKLSEATFRKYVQTGLLPRSRRVRRKGRRGGSLGLYPVNVVRRINEIKRLLAEDFTMEEIRGTFLCATSELDELEESLTRAFSRIESTVDEMSRTGRDVVLLQKEFEAARSLARGLTDALRKLERRLEMQASVTDNVRKLVV